jgi:hypothetical protein
MHPQVQGTPPESGKLTLTDDNLVTTKKGVPRLLQPPFSSSFGGRAKRHKTRRETRLFKTHITNMKYLLLTILCLSTATAAQAAKKVYNPLVSEWRHCYLSIYRHVCCVTAGVWAHRRRAAGYVPSGVPWSHRGSDPPRWRQHPWLARPPAFSACPSYFAIHT